MEFRILGPLQVLDQDRVLPLGGAKQRSTLAMLLLGRNRAVSREQLIDGLWGESPPPTAGPTLKTYVSRLRRVLHANGEDERLVTQPPGYRLRVEAGELDLECFETLLDRARTARASGDPEAAGDHLREALSLFRGAPLEDLAHAPFAEVEIGRLDELRLDALEERLEADLAVGRHAEVVGELELLAARHPFREALSAQLMLALYRSGRQGEALEAFDRARRTLAEELGVYPGQTLKELHRQILEQDPSLEPADASAPSGGVATSTGRASDEATDRPDGQSSAAPSTSRPAGPTPAPARAPPELEESFARPTRKDRARHRPFRPRRRVVAGGAALAVLVTLAAVLIPVLVGGRGAEPNATFRPGTVLIDLETGKEIESIPPSELAVAAYPLFADDHFWVTNWSPEAYVEIEPKDGRILEQLSPPPRDPTVHKDFFSTTPWAIEGDRLWVSRADDLVEVDAGLVDSGLGREVARFKLDDLGRGVGLAEGVAVGGGSLWVSRDVGRGQILRLDPATGRPEHIWNNITPYLHLAYGNGSLWVADWRGILRIDAETNLVTRVNDIRGNCGDGDGGCVAAGGGFGWATDASKGAIYKIDESGKIAATYDMGVGAGFVAYADGVLWVRNFDQGTVAGIDAVTGERTAIYRFGHPVDSIAVGDGVLLLQVLRGRATVERMDSLGENVARVFAHVGELTGSEPALNVDEGAYQIHFATCAKLLNYPDKPPPRGLRLRPEVAATMPTISPDGRTYRFTVRSGYRFSPPSNQVVNAETFRQTIERALSPRLAQNPDNQVPPGPLVINDIAGERAFRVGGARHISGLRARGDTLWITLTRPSPDFLERLALPFFCPVPRGTPTVAGAPRGTRADGTSYYIPSAGPYYVADYTGYTGSIILRRNPNYQGPRRQELDAIAIREGADASAALESVENQGWDGITSLSEPVLEPGRAVDRRWGARTTSAANGDRRYFLTPEARTRFIMFNAGRGVFADPSVRRAAALALDRDALAATSDDLPTDQLLSGALPGYQDQRLYPLQPSVAKARALMDRQKGRAVMPVPVSCKRCMEVARVVRTDLDGIGVDVEIRGVENFPSTLEGASRFDLVDARAGIPYPDSASFLAQMMRGIPPGWAPPSSQAKVERVARLSGDRRQGTAAALADRLATDDVAMAAYGAPQTSQFVGPGVGCRVFTPVGHGLDLAALCGNPESG